MPTKGKCLYCGDPLPDKANIRCDFCDNAWQAGLVQGEKQLREKMKETTTHLLRFLGVIE